jgi:2-isopropylmalate synthase
MRSRRALARAPGEIWDVPYLPIDPSDLGRSYDSIIRVNSQSGKGGVAYLLERDYQLVMPRRLQIEFSQVVQAAADITGKELTSKELWDLFTPANICPRTPFRLPLAPAGRLDGRRGQRAPVAADRARWARGDRGRPGLRTDRRMVKAIGLPFDVLSYEEHSRGQGSAAQAVSYIEITTRSRRTLFGAGMHPNIITASLLAVLSAVNRAIAWAARRRPGARDRHLRCADLLELIS